MSQMSIKQSKLDGTLTVQGAKNSALPILAAALIGEGKSVIHNCPKLTDIDAAIAILRHLGCGVAFADGTVTVQSETFLQKEIPDYLMREMRSSIVFLGAIIARTGSAVMSFPGGCELGPRPIDLHLSALQKLGVKIHEEGGHLHCSAELPLKGCEITLLLPSVGATENIMLAAATAKGTTVIRNAAREPEIEDLAAFLNACGARISGAGQSMVVVDGVPGLHAAEHTVIPDRIVSATYLAAAAATGGHILLRGICKNHLYPVLPILSEAGCRLTLSDHEAELTAPRRMRSFKTIRTGVYPGFPTDAQPPLMSLCCLASGTTIFIETIFENRFKHAGELCRMGADIKVEGRVAVVEGVRMLHGAKVEAPDLRGGAALVIAGLAAEGTTIVTGLHHIDRGYEDLPDNLRKLGADVVLQ